MDSSVVMSVSLYPGSDLNRERQHDESLAYCLILLHLFHIIIEYPVHSLGECYEIDNKLHEYNKYALFYST